MAPRARSDQPRKTNRGSLPAHLEPIEQIIDIEDKACPCCSGALHQIGDDVAERLDVVPTTFRVLVTRRPRYGCVARRLGRRAIILLVTITLSRDRAMTGFTLREGLSFSRTEGHAVFLDLEADRYFGLKPSLNQAFLAAIEAGEPGGEELPALMAAGILVPSAERKRPASCRRPESAAPLLLEDGRACTHQT